MSGGYFNYTDRYMLDVANQIEELVESKDYSEEFSEKFTEAAVMIKKSAERARLIDLLVCGDIGEETFMKRWKEKDDGDN